MKRILVGLSAILLVLSVFGNASADLITNGDFETGNFAGWSHSGDVQIVDLGNSLAGVFAGIQGMVGHFALLGAGTSDGTASLSQTFSLSNVPQVTLSFDWAFDFLDAALFRDDTLMSLVTTGGASVAEVKLLDLNTSVSLGVGAGLWSGHFEQSYDLASLGLTGATIDFVLSETAGRWADGTHSLAAFDNISARTTSSHMPEPATMLLLGVGLVGLSAFMTKARKNAKP